ncbi:guanylate cyclase 32E-like, partial [Diaphorina citri]|uniref:Guanylate cyclase n=1 Tax=Diaphorina citri TaxID=121845 RepID=A0A1S3DGV4_DIACI
LLHYNHMLNLSEPMDHLVSGFRSVLKLSPSHPRNPNFKAICEQIKNLSTLKPFNVPHHEKLFETISVSFDVYIDEHGDAEGNYSVVTLILDSNNQLTVLPSFDVYIDEHGDAEGNYSVVTLILDSNNQLTVLPSFDVYIDEHGDAEGNYSVVTLILDSNNQLTVLPSFDVYIDEHGDAEGNYSVVTLILDSNNQLTVLPSFDVYIDEHGDAEGNYSVVTLILDSNNQLTVLPSFDVYIDEHGDAEGNYSVVTLILDSNNQLTVLPSFDVYIDEHGDAEGNYSVVTLILDSNNQLTVLPSFDVYIDEHGDAEGNYSVVTLILDSNNQLTVLPSFDVYIDEHGDAEGNYSVVTLILDSNNQLTVLPSFDVYIDEHGDAEGNYSVVTLTLDSNNQLTVLPSFDVYIDEHGDAEGNYSVVTLILDSNNQLTVLPSLTFNIYFSSSYFVHQVLTCTYVDEHGDAEGNYSVVTLTLDSNNQLTVLPSFDVYIDEHGDAEGNYSVVTLTLDSNNQLTVLPSFDVYIDEHGDAEGNYSVVTLTLDSNNQLTVLEPVGYFQYTSLHAKLPNFRYYNRSKPIQWVGGKTPVAEPECGFDNEKCESLSTNWKQTLILSLLALAGSVTLFFAIRHYRYEQKLLCLLWKVEYKDITIIPILNNEFNETTQECASTPPLSPSLVRASVIPELKLSRAYTKIGFHKSNIVALKQIHKKNIDITREIRKELKQVRELRHENIIQFIGACVEPGNTYILTAYCVRGSLEQVLANQDVHLDMMFVSSLVNDLLKGMIHLHDSEIISHGNLRSSNCLIDSRWVLQIADFGLHAFKAGQDETGQERKLRRRKLYKAPELLRQPHLPRGTQKGDVYSFGLVLYEVIGRQGPWGHLRMTDEEIITSVTQGSGLRPDTSSLDCAPSIIACMRTCWEEDPELRPDLRFVHHKLKEMNAGLKANIFDNMLAIMEKYAFNLEGLVQERTNQLTQEKKKTDALLHRMLPRSVSESLKRGDFVEPESFDSVTIYFSDIVGFTQLSAESTETGRVTTRDLLTLFFAIRHYRYEQKLLCLLWKVEYKDITIIPILNNEFDETTQECASTPPLSPSLVRASVILYGPCVAGVVGLKMPRYCLFGDTVNTASRMESSGEAFKIHISSSTFELLEKLGGYYCEERGLVQIKGKGEMRTYWLLGEDSTRRAARLSHWTSSCRILEAPDLLRSPQGTQLLPEAYNPLRHPGAQLVHGCATGPQVPEAAY